MKDEAKVEKRKGKPGNMLKATVVATVILSILAIPKPVWIGLILFIVIAAISVAISPDDLEYEVTIGRRKFTRKASNPDLLLNVFHKEYPGQQVRISRK